jgi:hypothetical protein
MSLMRTRAIRLGSLIAFTADATASSGVSIMWGNPTQMGLTRGDVVQVLGIEVGDGTTWAKVHVLVVRGKRAGCTGFVSIDMGERLQRCWQTLTVSGSMAPVRAKQRSQHDVCDEGLVDTQLARSSPNDAETAHTGDENGYSRIVDVTKDGKLM